jgi:hypothetical protein
MNLVVDGGDSPSTPQSGIQDDRLHIATSFHERFDALCALEGNVGDTSKQPTAAASTRPAHADERLLGRS